MEIVIRGKVDRKLTKVKQALEVYKSLHPAAEISLYRQDNVSIRIRIIDEHFAKMKKFARHDEVWDFLAEQLADDDLMADISLLLLISPGEVATSLMNLEFEDPVPAVR